MGDISNKINLIEYAFKKLKKNKEVCYVPGNHDLWVNKKTGYSSFDKFKIINKIADTHCIKIKPFHIEHITIIPLLGWFDYSFGYPTEELKNIWLDYTACSWPLGFNEQRITEKYINLNVKNFIIKNQLIYPALGTKLLEEQIRKIGSDIHIYGHSHLNVKKYKDDILYLNNAYGYPHEKHITAKKMICIFKD